MDLATRSILSLDWSDGRPGGPTITRVSVLPPHRRKGIASRLLRECLEEADRFELNLYLEPIPSAGADGPDRDQLIAWYESFGFEPYGPERGFTWVRRPTVTPRHDCPHRKNEHAHDGCMFVDTDPAVPWPGLCPCKTPRSQVPD